MTGPSRLLLAASAATAVALLSTAPLARADVLSFDDLLGPPAFFVTNYRGFQFGTNVVATSGWFHTTQADATYQPHSGTVYIASTPFTGASTEDSQRITNATPFLFSGAWFSGASDSIAYKLYSGNTLVYTSPTSTALPGAPRFFANSYTGLVTSVVISGTQGNFALDDFTYSFATVVPEPATAVLTAGGLALVGLGVRLGRRRRR